MAVSSEQESHNVAINWALMVSVFALDLPYEETLARLRKMVNL